MSVIDYFLKYGEIWSKSNSGLNGMLCKPNFKQSPNEGKS